MRECREPAVAIDHLQGIRLLIAATGRVVWRILVGCISLRRPNVGAIAARRIGVDVIRYAVLCSLYQLVRR